MIRILVADDHEVVRQGLRRAIESRPDMRVVGEAADGIGVLEMISRTYADILLLDSGMPGPGPLFLIDEIKSRRASLPILILSVDPDERTAVMLLRQGATGFMTKDHSPEELDTAIRRVSSGRRYLNQELSQALAEHVQGVAAAPAHAVLSPRELHVLIALARGVPVTRIARDLDLSTHTVNAHRSRVLSRLGCANMAELVRYASRYGLVATTPPVPRSSGLGRP